MISFAALFQEPAELGEHQTPREVFGAGTGARVQLLGVPEAQLGAPPQLKRQRLCERVPTDRSPPFLRPLEPAQPTHFPAEAGPRSRFVSELPDAGGPRSRPARSPNPGPHPAQGEAGSSGGGCGSGLCRAARWPRVGSVAPRGLGGPVGAHGRGGGTGEGCVESWEAGKRGRLGGGAGQWEAQSMMSPRSSQRGSG